MDFKKNIVLSAIKNQHPEQKILQIANMYGINNRSVKKIISGEPVRADVIEKIFNVIKDNCADFSRIDFISNNIDYQSKLVSCRNLRNSLNYVTPFVKTFWDKDSDITSENLIEIEDELTTIKDLIDTQKNKDVVINKNFTFEELFQEEETSKEALKIKKTCEQLFSKGFKISAYHAVGDCYCFKEEREFEFTDYRILKEEMQSDELTNEEQKILSEIEKNGVEICTYFICRPILYLTVQRHDSIQCMNINLPNFYNAGFDLGEKYSRNRINRFIETDLSVNQVEEDIRKYERKTYIGMQKK